MKIAFITTNKHKFEEAQKILAHFDIEIERLEIDYEENHDSSMETIASNAAKNLSRKLSRPIITEDTGLFFEAYKNFPGALPKFVFNSLGYRGIFKLLEGETHQAYFETAVAYCTPDGEPEIFGGKMKGTITTEIYNPEIDAMPYDRIFIPDGKSKTISDMTIDEKNELSQRAESFTKLAKYLVKNSDNLN